MKKISPDEAVEFLESFRLMMGEQDLPTKAISLRVPENLIQTLKVMAKRDNKKYQSMIVEAMRDYIRKNA